MRIEPAAELWRCLRPIRWLRFVARSGRLTGWNGIGAGSVVVESPHAGVLNFAEAGSWRPAAGEETRFQNVFRWELLGTELVRMQHLRFGEGSPVYLFDLAPDAASSWYSVSPHLCNEDSYSAELRLEEWGVFLRWLITGPRKQECIEYEYRREGNGDCAARRPRRADGPRLGLPQ